MTALDRTALLLKRNRGRWLNALVLARAGGLLSFRTRVSECRTVLGMDVQNKVERSKRGARSFYRYVGRKAA